MTPGLTLDEHLQFRGAVRFRRRPGLGHRLTIPGGCASHVAVRVSGH
jgi:hypothetical protein